MKAKQVCWFNRKFSLKKIGLAKKLKSLFFSYLYIFEKHLFTGKLSQLSLLVKKACCLCLASLVNAILGVWLLFSPDSSSNTFNIKQLFVVVVVVVQNFASLFFDVFSLKISVSISSLCLRQYFTLRANEPSNRTVWNLKC